MLTDFCIICGEREGLENHHLIPRSIGGTDLPENMISLCREHHGNLHGFTTEKKSLSELTKAALAKSTKKLGTAGTTNLKLPQTIQGTKACRAINKQKALDFAALMLPIILGFKQQGFTNVKIAEELNKLKYAAPGGKVGKWTSVGVSRCLKRAA